MMSHLIDRVVVSGILGDGVTGRVADQIIDRIPGGVLNELVNRAPARVAERAARRGAADPPRYIGRDNWDLADSLDERSRLDDPT